MAATLMIAHQNGLAGPGPPWLRPRARTCKLREFGTRPTTRSDNMTGPNSDDQPHTVDVD